MKILLAGDTHGDLGHVNSLFFHAQRTGCERIIQLGDFGYGWKFRDIKGGIRVDEFSWKTSKMAQRYGIDIEWIDGNHENFERLYEIPVGEDGRREILPGVYHLPRGYRFEIEGVTFLCCGGAISVDYRRRSPYISWWPQEAITEADIDACEGPAVRVLLTHDMPVDSEVFDHHVSRQWPEDAVRRSVNNRLALATIADSAQPDIWFHGHIHHSYTQEARLRGGGKPYLIRGLDMNGTSMAESAQVIECMDGKLTLV